ncbi:hypothetical protein ACS0TY_034223 [Phlomoides rotata]
MIDDTTALSYWLNWRFLLCAVWVLVAMVFATLLIWRYEGSRKIRDEPSGFQQEVAGCLYDDEVWGTCSKSIHPIWLLAYRVVAFCTLLAVLLADFVINGAGKIFFYTEWTFTLVTIYFGLASSLSIIGYLRYCHEVEPESTTDNADRGSYVPPILGEGTDTALETGSLNCYCEPKFRTVALVWGYALQIIFQYNYEVEYLPARREAGQGKGLASHDIVDMSELYTDIMGRSSKEGLPWASSADFNIMCSSTEPSDYVRAIDSKSKQDYQLVEAM